MKFHNKLGQPIGEPIENQDPATFPPKTSLSGEYCELIILDAEKHAKELFNVFSQDTSGANWTYLLSGPFDNYADFYEYLVNTTAKPDPLFYAIRNKKNNELVGIASYLRINPKFRVIEVGHIHFSPLLQRTPMATEAMFLMMQNSFDELGYRRYEWKCDSLNEKSRRAAERFGFTFEGVFRQALFYKNRSRDTAWYSIVESEWPAIRKAFKEWLAPGNFDLSGNQKSSLRELISGIEKG